MKINVQFLNYYIYFFNILDRDLARSYPSPPIGAWQWRGLYSAVHRELESRFSCQNRGEPARRQRFYTISLASLFVRFNFTIPIFLSVREAANDKVGRWQAPCGSLFALSAETVCKSTLT